jgi:hypothetical protein
LEIGPTGPAEREFIVGRGSWQLRRRAEVGETVGDKAKAVRLGRRVNNCKGAVALRGVRTFHEGKTLKGDPRNGLWHETRPRRFDGLKTLRG